ncbi:hypothetical protein Ais01nite_16030 [Asanoa ishikariensis]|uniref:Galactose oxidase, central domain n=1 Tax=Asanoa ishikariensis TaxID=137265 RepID=A0A1H3UGH2_9ACTN|nr:kelch repeat-containing protein [Asanoa ishikariensis]GIF63568.1 hypothetical protein Ais01nite_16030 [Asanoa ishikariensis]SDZ61553.1 Galactose oxidase, central domain [Asanoa ishikariensis]
MNEAESVRALLVTVAERGAGEQIVPPVADLIGRARRSRRRRQTVACAVVLAVAAAVAVPQAVLDRGPAERSVAPSWQGYPATGPGTAIALAAGRWSRLPSAPIPGRSDAATAWTGTEMLVWGGRVADSARADGAAYRPSDQRWTVLPPAPLTARFGMAYTWTGAVLFVWGGGDTTADGAVYDPAARIWRLLPTSPLSPRTDATALWTGREVLVLGGRSEDGRALVDAAAYDPATSRWRSLPALPAPPDHPVDYLVPVVTGDQVYVWAPWAHRVHTSPNTIHTNYAVDLFRFDTRTDTWSTPELTGDAPAGARQPLWTGREIIVPAAFPYRPGSGPIVVNLRGSRLDPADGRWRTMTHGPIDDRNGQYVWTGAAVISFDNAGAGAVWDPGADRWTTIPDAPRAPAESASMVWTGTHLLIWGELGPPESAGLSYGS